jgi:hypothetical protein
LGGTNREEGGKKQKIPPTPSRKGKKQAHQEGMRSLPISCRKFLFPKLWVTIIFVAFVCVVELISFQFLHLFLSRFVCWGNLFLFHQKGARESTHSQPPNPQSCPWGVLTTNYKVNFFPFVMSIFDWPITIKSIFEHSQKIYIVISSFGLLTHSSFNILKDSISSLQHFVN